MSKESTDWYQYEKNSCDCRKQRRKEREETHRKMIEPDLPTYKKDEKGLEDLQYLL